MAIPEAHAAPGSPNVLLYRWKCLKPLAGKSSGGVSKLLKLVQTRVKVVSAGEKPQRPQRGRNSNSLNHDFGVSSMLSKIEFPVHEVICGKMSMFRRCRHLAKAWTEARFNPRLRAALIPL